MRIRTSPGTVPWHRAARTLARLHRHPATPPHPSRPAQVRALTAVLDEAVAAQTPADAAVAACGEPGPVSGPTARACCLQSIALQRLRTRLQDLELTDPELLRVQAQAARLLAFDLWMLRESLNLAFTIRPDDRTEAARLHLNGLGRHADDLRRLRDGLNRDDR